MNKETERPSEEKDEKAGLRIAQVLAAALAAVTAALLGSTIGVAGTVAGAGLASIITTVGGELYLRSLHRTRSAALKAREVLTLSGTRRRGELPGPSIDRGPVPGLAEQPTVRLPRPALDGPPEEEPGRLRKLRWPLIIGTSVVAFVVAILAIVGFERATGTQVGGGTGGSIGKIFGGGSGHSQETPTQTPATPTTTPTETTSPTSTGTSVPPTSTTPSTIVTSPSTTTPPTTAPSSATPTQGAAATPTP